MRADLYAKAARLLAEGRVRLEDESESAAYFRVRGEHGDHLVRLASDHRFSCTCPYGSLKGRHLCSHVVTAILAEADAVSGS